MPPWTRTTSVLFERATESQSVAQQTALRDELDDDGTPSDRPDDRGDILCHGFWRRGRTTIFDVRVTDTDASSYLKREPQKVLANQEQAKKRKYLNPCEERRCNFTPLVFSVDGMRGPSFQNKHRFIHRGE